EVASLFVTGYALEKVLSVDNLFVMMAIFSWFSVPDRYRHRVLYWGIIGAIVFRGIFVAIGTGLLSLGPYVELIFAVVV
ncbi:tellurium resistance protein TerC, partial [Klebsiella pneumoniae]|nr:tellurium resistance protein TerC [Klebsiella pneumoniae]